MNCYTIFINCYYTINYRVHYIDCNFTILVCSRNHNKSINNNHNCWVYILNVVNINII